MKTTKFKYMVKIRDHYIARFDHGAIYFSDITDKAFLDHVYKLVGKNFPLDVFSMNCFQVTLPVPMGYLNLPIDRKFTLYPAD